MSFYFRLTAVLNKLVEYVVAVLLTVMVVTVFLQVIFRFVIHSSLPWSEELARYILVWISFLGASIGVKRKAHIGVSVITNMLGGVAAKIVSVLIPFLSAVFFLFLAIYGYRILDIVTYQLSPAMEISMAFPYSSITVSGVLMLLYSLQDMMKAITGKRGDQS